jgi:hypothetical protein
MWRNCNSPTLLLNLENADALLKRPFGQALVAHACNPSYSGGRDEEVHGSKPARANSLRDPILKIAIT